jgi:NAD(P)-dependent dehydrogenase (short-subunit alcohol dehydrogenase family)
MSKPEHNNRGAALVIGGSGGLGSAICQTLAEQWDAVYFTYNSNETAALQLAEQLSLQCNVGYSSMDLRDQQSINRGIEQCIATVGSIGTVIFASGAKIAQPYVADILQSDWDEVFDIELTGFTRLVRAMIPHFRQQGGGNFVSVVSFAPYHFPPGDALSAVPKAGIEVLCRAIAREEGRNGIRANSVAPGIINAGLGSEFQDSLFTPEIWQQQKQRVPLKRFGEAVDIAECVAFLASSKAAYVTGQTLIVDGGLQL